MSTQIKKAIVLAAGRGSRMAPLTDHCPKPLVEVGGRALIDRAIDRLEAAGVEEVVVNLHYMADMMEAHLRKRTSPRIIFSDERDALLETGGGVKRALPLLGDAPFFAVNSDALWIDNDGGTDNLVAMMDAYDEGLKGCSLLVAVRHGSVGYTGRGDFHMDEACHLARRNADGEAPYMYAGVQIMHPSVFDGIEDTAFSNNLVWDRLNPQGRLFGHKLEGRWLHASSVKDVAAINEVLKGES